MKNLFLIFVLALSANFAFAQVKVVTNGFTKIGNTSVAPAEQLDVDGRVRLSRANGNVIAGGSDVNFTMSNNTSTVNSRAYFAMFGNQAGRVGEFTVAGTYVRFFSNVQNGNPNQFGQEAMRILDNGQVGIGLSNPSASALLHVNGAIHNAGGVVTSDKRLKNNINDFSLGLDEVLKLKPYTFNYNGQANIKTEDLQVGIMAQEFAKIMPEAVGTYTHEERDIDNNLVSSEDYLYANTEAIKYMLVNAVKEQQDLINKQAERIAALEEAFSSIGSVDGINRSEVTLNIFDLAELGDNSPNPFTGSTNIDYIVPSDAKSATMNIIGLNGQVMKTISIDHTGEGILTVNANDIPSGTYTYNLLVDGKNIATKKMVVAN